MGLGSARAIDLAEARKRATAARAELDRGVDPLDKVQNQVASELPAAPTVSFKQCAERYIDAHRVGWRNEKHQDQWTSTLAQYAYPSIGELDVRAVDTGHLCTILEPIWTAKPATASRVRGRIEAVLNWATARGYRTGENPARWRGHLENLLAATSRIRRTRHHPSMPYGDLPAFVQDLRGYETQGARALEFVILTAARTGEAIGADWGEIDMAARVWTVPAERMKANKLHRVPLSDRAIEILEAQRKATGASGPVFRGQDGRRPLSNMAMLAILGRTGRSNITVHGFRSSFRDWVAERTSYPREIAEAALAHVNGDRVESAYLRSDHFEKRRSLMAMWAAYCSSPAVEAEVLPIRRA
jgi:integrase